MNARTPDIRKVGRGLCVVLLAVAAVLGGAGAGDAAFPGGNGKVVFASSRTGDFEVFAMDADGSNQQNLTAEAVSDDLEPAWSPDGARVAFSSNRDGASSAIWVMNADGSAQARLTTDLDWEPAWSHDGQRIAFRSRRDSGSEIYVMNADGSGQARLTLDGSSFEPAWSPDGQKIAFRSRRDGADHPSVYVMNADGSGQQALMTEDGREPSWSPDGAKIVFTSFRDGVGGEIYVMNADGSGQTRLTSNAFQDTAPAWSPDGQKILFESDRDGNREVYLMNVDGTAQTRLTIDPAFDGQPDWQTGAGGLSQTITVTISAPATAVFGTSFTVAATASSGLPVSYSSSGACTNTGATFTMTSGTGTCTVSYDQQGNAQYDPAPQVTQSVAAQQASQTITFPVIPDKTLGDPDFDPGATASSGLPVGYTAVGPCSIVSGLVHLDDAGSCTVTASQPGDANYEAAPSVSRSFTVAGPSPLVGSFTPTSGRTGTSVTIQGQNLSGATAVVFDGGKRSAKFTIVSSTQITAIVPHGAKSGPISVKTPSGTGVSTQSFTVLKK